MDNTTTSKAAIIPESLDPIHVSEQLSIADSHLENISDYLDSRYFVNFTY